MATNLQYETIKVAYDAALSELNTLKRKRDALSILKIGEKLKLTAAIALLEPKVADLKRKLDSVNPNNSSAQTQTPWEKPFVKSEPVVQNLSPKADPDEVQSLASVFEGYFNSARFSNYNIKTNVPAEYFGANPLCKPIQFLFCNGETPVLAVAIVTKRGYTHGAVTGTQNAVRSKGIKYVRFFTNMPNEEDYVVSKVSESL